MSLNMFQLYSFFSAKILIIQYIQCLSKLKLCLKITYQYSFSWHSRSFVFIREPTTVELCAK